MKVIGIDPSMTATGLCAWDGTTSTIRTVAKQRDNRLRVIRGAVTEIAYTSEWQRGVAPSAVKFNQKNPNGCPSYPVSLAVVEMPSPGLKGPAILSLHMVQAAVRMALMDAGVPYVTVLPQYVKAYAGWARNDKDAMARAAYETDGSVFDDDNQCDAWWLRQMAMDHYGLLRLGTRRVSATQRAWLDKVVWPDLDRGTVL